jgi:hypothetical protein
MALFGERRHGERDEEREELDGACDYCFHVPFFPLSWFEIIEKYGQSVVLGCLTWTSIFTRLFQPLGAKRLCLKKNRAGIWPLRQTPARILPGETGRRSILVEDHTVNEHVVAFA